MGETRWTIEDSNGSEVFKGGDHPAGSTTIVSECFDEGTYKFKIEDDYGDGICCAPGKGGYKVKVDGTEVASGGDFGSSEEKSFDVGPGSPTAPTTPSPVSPPTPSPVKSPSYFYYYGNYGSNPPANYYYDFFWPGSGSGSGSPVSNPSTPTSPTPYPTQKAPTPFPTHKPPTPYPTGAAPTPTCSNKGDPCQSKADCCVQNKQKCKKNKCKK